MADYRYPGLRPFEDTDLDRSLFFGRDREKEELLHLILAEKLTVVFAKSGTGKSSLLNAGILQALRERDFLPIKIRFNDSRFTPLETIYQAIADTATRQQFDAPTAERDTLARYFQAAEFWSARDTLLTPALIFDQFEEFFETYDSTARREFIAQFAECVKAKQIGLKVVIALREDYLAQLEELAPEMPEIFSHRFRLTALRRPQAQAAIECPARSQDGAAPAFCYAPETLAAMLDFLGKRKERDTIVQTDEIEPSQLQLLCQHVEQTILPKKRELDAEMVILPDDFGGENGMERILQEFYDNQLKRLGSFHRRCCVRKLCEERLISATGHRLFVAEEQIQDDCNVSKTILKELVEARLLRMEFRLGSAYYELTHDSLIKPIQESGKSRRFFERSLKYISVVSIIILSAFVVYMFVRWYAQTRQKEQQLQQQQQYTTYRDEGLMLFQKREYEKARNYFNKALALEWAKKEPTSYILLGYALFKLHKYDEAKANFNKALEPASSSNSPFASAMKPFALVGMGNILYAQGNSEQAMKFYQQALAEYTNAASSYDRSRGAIYYVVNKQFKEATECARSDLQTRLILIVALFGQGKRDDGMVEMRNVIQSLSTSSFDDIPLYHEESLRNIIALTEEILPEDKQIFRELLEILNIPQKAARDKKLQELQARLPERLPQ